MKKITLVITIAAITGFSVNAQITITQSNMPAVGNKFIEVYDSSGTIKSPGGSGASQTWNFSTMNAKSPDTVKVIATSSTPSVYTSQLPSANLALTLSQNPGTYEYLNSAAAGLTLEGLVVNSGSYGFVLYKYNPTWEFIALPATYKNHWGGTYTANMRAAYTIAGTTYDSIGEIEIATYHDTVDSWGTVTTPSGTYNCIRVKHTEIGKDSEIVHQTGSTWLGFPATTDTNDYYEWYTNTANYSLVEMSVNSAGTITKIQWLKNAIAGIDEVTNNNRVIVYPNPANNELNIQTSGFETGNVTIYDMTGKVAADAFLNNGRALINTSNYADGMYLYVITDKEGQLLARDKFSIAR